MTGSGPVLDADLLALALAWAAKAHAGQRSKGTAAPYIAHPLAVASIAIDHGADSEQAAAALLHDVLEDSPTTFEQLEAAFGGRVAHMVRDLSDTEDHRGKSSWHGRKERYLRHLAGVDPATALISMCDKLHNATRIVRDLEQEGVAVFDRFQGRRDGTLWYYRELVTTYDRMLPAPHPALLERVRLEVEAMHRLAALERA